MSLYTSRRGCQCGIACCMAVAAAAHAQTVNVVSSTDAQALAESLVGTGVQVVPGSATLIGVPNQQGFFSVVGGDVFGFTDGIVLTSGSINNLPGTNTVPDATASLGTPGDAALSALSGFPTFDANILQFKFTVDPNVTALGFNFVFASEEYNEYVGTQFNDVFAFFVDGQNIATVPGSAQPIAVNTINGGNPNNATPPSNPQFYVNNDPFDPPTVAPGNLTNTQMDGYTTVLFADVLPALDPGATEHTMRLAIADASDPILDSAVMIQLGSFGVPEPTEPRDCQVAFEPTEPNDECVGPMGGQTIVATEECVIINGKLETRLRPGPRPDTWLAVFDKFGGLIASDDNSSEYGDGKASGMLIGDGNGDGWSELLVDNGDGTRSLRIAVTGFPDGFDGNVNGLFQNAPHGQIGQFTVHVDYIMQDMTALDDFEPTPQQLRQTTMLLGQTEGAAEGGLVLRTDTYTGAFVTGAEAFHINFTPAPDGSQLVRINIDNTTGMIEECNDVDFMCISGLEPLESYCVTVVGGLDEECNPTDTQLSWLDKDCDVIATDNDSGPAPGYSQLCVIADANGVICIAVSGGGDSDADGLVGGLPHGVCGTYSLLIEPASGGVISQPPDAMIECDDAAQQVINLTTLGDLNMDGVVDGADLAKLLSNWGLITQP